MSTDLPHEQHFCNARKKSGGLCKRPTPQGRCKWHGGASLRGIASPQFKTGRYSQVLPGRLLARYQEAQADPELLAARDEIALVDSRLSDLLSRVDTGESGSLWRKATEAMDDLRVAKTTGDKSLFADALNALEKTIGQGTSDYAAWDEVGKLLDRRQRLVESERKRLIEMHQVITAERVMVLIAALTDIIKRHVTDRPTLSAISNELIRLVGAPTRGEPESRERAG